MNIKIREAVQTDHGFILDCQLRMALETEGMQLDPNLCERGVLAVLRDPNKGRYFVAEDDAGKLIACVLTMYEWSDWRNGNVIWIHSLFVLPAYRKQGVWRSMYEFLKERVMESPDLRGLRLYVDKRNTLAQAAYVKLGMTAEHYDLYEWLKSNP
jgi:GNAT superfamily N-acetyltransferase